MKYYTASISKKEKEALTGKWTPLDKQVLEVCKPGVGISFILAKCKQFFNIQGSREYHDSEEIAESIKWLLKKGLLIRR